MNDILSNSVQRLHELNTLLATCNQSDFSFGQALSLSLFYRDFNDTNSLVREAEILARENPDRLSELSLSLLSEAGRYLSSDKSVLYAANFERIFEEHLKPFEQRHEEAKTVATRLWRDYSAKSNRLDFLPLESEEYRLLDEECDAAKAEYDKAHANTTLLYKEWQQERERYFCVYCFKPLFLDVLVERLKGIAESIIADIKHMKEGKP